MNYTINGCNYQQKPLVLGQIAQLVPLLQGIRFTSFEAMAVVVALADKLPEVLAIVLRRENEPLKDKNLADYGADMAEADFATAMQVVVDFFTCNPLPSLLEQVSGVISTILETMTTTGSTRQFASFPEETSREETPSSGDTLLANAPHI